MRRMKKVRRRGFLVIFLIAELFFLNRNVQPCSGNQKLTWISGNSFDPAISIDRSDSIYVAWGNRRTRNFKVYYKKSIDGGKTWSVAKKLIWHSDYSWEAATAKDSNNNIHVVWHDRTSGNYEIYYMRATDKGVTWSEPMRLTWSKGNSMDPAIAIDSDNNIHIVWCDDVSGNYEIYYKKNNAKGKNWTSANRLTWSSGDSYSPTLAIDSNNNIHVIWYDNISGKSEIYYKKSTDGGSTWTDTRRLTWTVGASSVSALAIDPNDSIQIVCEDDNPNNCDIFCK
jgi:hypothetical protein